MMILSALLTSAVVTLSDNKNLSRDMREFTKEASQWVLEGRTLPPEYRKKLQKMKPSDRLQAIVFLRRSGMLRENVWTLDDVLRDPEKPEQADK